MANFVLVNADDLDVALQAVCSFIEQCDSENAEIMENTDGERDYSITEQADRAVQVRDRLLHRLNNGLKRSSAFWTKRIESDPIGEKQLATILAALRLWQADIDPNEIPVDFADFFADHPALSADEIDELCESLNCGA